VVLQLFRHLVLAGAFAAFTAAGILANRSGELRWFAIALAGGAAQLLLYGNWRPGRARGRHA
jgi:hypothetical protein